MVDDTSLESDEKGSVKVLRDWVTFLALTDSFWVKIDIDSNSDCSNGTEEDPGKRSAIIKCDIRWDTSATIFKPLTTECDILPKVFEKASTSEGTEIWVEVLVDRLSNFTDKLSSCGDKSFNNICSGVERFFDTVGSREDKNTNGDKLSVSDMDISEVRLSIPAKRVSGGDKASDWGGRREVDKVLHVTDRTAVVVE